MNIIDHRILIPAPQDKVWLHISDIAANPRWQTDCKAVSILTTMHSGPGMRWRYTTRTGRDYVAEITAWYDRLGYEYRLIDGTRYRSNKGVLRLQEVPEGTIVQWTFNYEPSGLFGGFWDSLSTRRRIEGNIIDSLRALYRYVGKSLDKNLPPSRSLMREAPDVEARAHYRPRHNPTDPPPTAPVPSITAPVPGGSRLTEPPVAEGDTKPNPVIGKTPTPAPATQVSGVREPDFLANIPQTEPSLPAVPPAPSVADTHAAYRPPEVPPAPFQPLTPPAASASPPTQTTAPAPTTRIPVSTPPTGEPTPPAEPVNPFDLPRIVEGPTSEIDTSKVSVFELFGLPKPSETQEMRPVTAASPMPDTPTATIPATLAATDLTPTVQVPALTPAFSIGRIGLRLRLRYKRAALRRPG